MSLFLFLWLTSKFTVLSITLHYYQDTISAASRSIYRTGFLEKIHCERVLQATWIYTDTALRPSVVNTGIEKYWKCWFTLIALARTMNEVRQWRFLSTQNIISTWYPYIKLATRRNCIQSQLILSSCSLHYGSMKNEKTTRRTWLNLILVPSTTNLEDIIRVMLELKSYVTAQKLSTN